MTNDPKILIEAFLGGIIPSLLWLWFWLTEEENKPEPKGIIAVIFILGMISVICVLPIQKFVQEAVSSANWQIVLWATTEELMKFLAVIVVVYKTDDVSEPIDWPIYLITAALGFAALENALYLIHPLSMGQNTVSLLTGQLRFLGSTVLHTVASGILGISLAISMHMGVFKKSLYVFVGLILAISLHSVFNFFIIRDVGDGFMKVFGFLWVVTIILMLLFEKVRRMN